MRLLAHNHAGPRSAVWMLAVICACVIAPIGLSASGTNRVAATSQSTKTLYAVRSKTAFVNNNDDRARGVGKNPFGQHLSATNSTSESERLFGPFAGDEGVFSFKLYSDPTHKTPAGTAIFICQYNFNQDSFCDTSLNLGDGTLVGKGAYTFNASDFALAIQGGTGHYQHLNGVMAVKAAGLGTQPQPAFRAAPMLQNQQLTLNLIPLSVGATTHSVTAYSAPTHETFVNNDDDEARGGVNNPFGTHNTQAGPNNENLEGPFAGDEAFFSFNTYGTQTLTKTTGNAVFTCQYYFFKNAFCDASFTLKNGTLIAAGALNFASQSFSLAVTGGTGAYTGLSGAVNVTPSGKNAQKLDFVRRGRCHRDWRTRRPAPRALPGGLVRGHRLALLLTACELEHGLVRSSAHRRYRDDDQADQTQLHRRPGQSDQRLRRACWRLGLTRPQRHDAKGRSHRSRIDQPAGNRIQV